LTQVQWLDVIIRPSRPSGLRASRWAISYFLLVVDIIFAMKRRNGDPIVKNDMTFKMKSISGKEFEFKAILERWASGMEYYAIPIPNSITVALQTRAAVPVKVKINSSDAFLASLFPAGEGRHYLRIRNNIVKAVQIKEKDIIKVKIKVRNRENEILIPRDLKTALKEAGAEREFNALPIGKKSYLLRGINEAVKAETREKRIKDVVRKTVNK
jgi:hypothetical protein